MKTRKWMYLLVLGVALTFTVTGCKSKRPPIKGIPASQSGSQTDGLPANPTFTPEPGPGTGGDLPTWDPKDFDHDRSALAAETVHFDFDSAVVKASEMSHVEAVAARLSGDGAAKLIIEGHCDERGTEEYNRSLGERRALALRSELASRGIDAGRVRTLSFGEDQPVDPAHDESAWSKNRRGVFVLLHPKQ